MTPRTGSSVSIAILIGSLLLAIVPQFYLWSHVTDDAYISFRYAERCALGNGLTFNDNEKVEGFSNPLWTILLAMLFNVTGISIVDAARSLGMFFTLLTFVCAWWTVESLKPESRVQSVVMTLLMILLLPGFHVYATAGLEGPLFSMLLTFGVGATVQQRIPWRYAAAISFGLAGVTRPEGALYGMLWFLTTLESRTRLRDSALHEVVDRHEYIRFALLALPILAWQLFRVQYFGAWLPNTAIAKMPGTFGGITFIPYYLMPFILATGGPLTLLFWFLTKRTREPQSDILFRSSIGVVMASLIFVFYTQGDWMPFGRFVVPIWPIVVLNFVFWFRSAVRSLKNLGALRVSRFEFVLSCCALITASVFAWQLPVRSYVANKEGNMLMRGTDQVAVGEWLAANVRAGATVATGRLGGISFAAPHLTVWDLNGLTDAAEAAYVAKKRPGGIAGDPILQRMPDVIAAVAVPAEWGYEQDAEFMDWLQKRYTFHRRFPQGNFGSIDVWMKGTP